MKPKPKPQKKKKKKDPNEPQKPVSAYALFFRDTQAAIKGQNPNATFGDVSKIVASMWDGLGEEQKQVETELVWDTENRKKCRSFNPNCVGVELSFICNTVKRLSSTTKTISIKFLILFFCLFYN